MTTNTSPPPHSSFSGRTLFRVGIGLVLVAAALFLGYSVDQGWIGPLTRVVLAALGGGVMVAAGTAIAGRRPTHGRLLQGAGSGVLFLTVYAAHTVSELTSTTEAFVQFTAVAALVIGLAIRERSEVLAGIGLTAAAIAPAAFGGRMEIGGEIGHLAIVAIAASALAWRFDWMWSLLGTAAAMSVAAGLDVLGVAGDLADLHLQVAITLAWAMVVAVPIARSMVDGVGRDVALIGSAAGSIAFYIATAWIWADLSMSGRSVLALALAAGHLLVARALPSRGLNRLAATQWIPAAALVLAAGAETLPAEWLVVGTSAASVALIAAGRRMPTRATDAGHLLFLLTALMAVGFVTEAGDRTLFDLVPGAFVLASALAMGALLKTTDSSDLAVIYLTAALGGSIAWVLAEFPRLGADGVAWVTAGWTAIGVTTVAAGRVVRSRAAFGAGLSTIGLAVGKLLLVDLATADPVVRIGLFTGVGILLLATGYWLGDDETENDDTRVIAG